MFLPFARKHHQLRRGTAQTCFFPPYSVGAGAIRRKNESPIRLRVHFSARGITLVFKNDRNFSDWVARRVLNCALNRDRIFLLGGGLCQHWPARKTHPHSRRRDKKQTIVTNGQSVSVL